jgi:cysteinyl-tRNA synthetase
MSVHSQDASKPTPADLAEVESVIQLLCTAIEDAKQQLSEAEEESRRNTELRLPLQAELANRHRTTQVRHFQARPQAKQAVLSHQLIQLTEACQKLYTLLHDMLLRANAQALHEAQQIHEALREASKTDPSLLDAVRELDELARQAATEEEEDAA